MAVAVQASAIDLGFPAVGAFLHTVLISAKVSPFADVALSSAENAFIVVGFAVTDLEGILRFW